MNSYELYKLNTEQQQLIYECMNEETGEVIFNEDALEMFEKLQVSKQELAENFALAFKNSKLTAELLKTEIDSLTNRYRIEVKNKEKYKDLLKRCLAGEKLKTTKVSVSYRKSDEVAIDDISKLESEYLMQKEPTANKTAIKQAFKTGVIVRGATLIEKQNLIIK